jgi:glutaredoxin
MKYWSVGVLNRLINMRVPFAFSITSLPYFFITPLLQHSIIPYFHYSNTSFFFHYSNTPLFHFLYSKHLAHKRNDGRRHNNTDNACYNRRGCRIPHCRRTPLTLHPPETPREGHQDSKNSTMKEPYPKRSQTESLSSPVHVLDETQIEHADPDDQAAQDAQKVRINAKQGHHDDKRDHPR